MWQAGTCVPCGAGTFSLAQATTCLNCSAGSYSSANASACQACVNGTWSAFSATACVACRAGLYSETVRATSNATCLPCPNGTASSDSGVGWQGSCLWCSAGLYATAGSTACLTCPNLTYSPAQAASCLGCPAFSDSPAGSSLDKCVCRAGYVQNNTFQPFTCQPCLLGTYLSGNQSSACIPCPAGFYGLISRAASLDAGCGQCGLGTYSQAQATACILCPAGNFTALNGSSQCMACPTGTWGSSGASACNPCPPGTFSNTTLATNSTACQPCPSGTYSTNTGVSSINFCYPCPAGSSSDAGAVSCAGCPANTFNNLETRQCVRCPSNSSSLSGSIMNGCLCDPGFSHFYRSRAVGGYEIYVPDAVTGQLFRSHRFFPAGTIQILKATLLVFVCDDVALYRSTYEEGVYQVPGDFLARSSKTACSSNANIQYDVSGAFDASESTTYFKCVACEAGKYSSAPGQEVCFTCPAGKYQADTSGTYCNACDTGYVSADGAANCNGCSAGQYQADATKCLPCPAGTSSGTAPATQCSVCPPNFWSAIGSQTCTECPYFSFSPGGTDLQGCLCKAGTYFRSEDGSCQVCLPGTYSINGATACSVCAPGTITDFFGYSNCIACGQGLYTDGPGASVCQSCAVGFIPRADKSACEACPLGYYCLPDGSAAPCPDGTIVNGTGLNSVDQCIQCPANNVCPDKQTIQPCPQNTHSEPGATSMMQCECDIGFSCTYTKTLNAVVELPMSPDQFALLTPEFIKAVAEAAGVDPSNVVINSVISIPPRRAFQHKRTGTKVHFMLKGVRTLNRLDDRLLEHGLPRTLRRVVVQRGRVEKVVARKLA